MGNDNSMTQHLRATFEEAPNKILSVVGIENIRGKSILDLVCGEMVLDFAMISREAQHVVGVDGVEDRDLIGKTGQRLAENGFAFPEDFRSRLSYRPYDWSTLPAEAAEFDTIISWGAFHRIPNVQTTLQEMNRVLVSGGAAFICVFPWWHSAQGSQLNAYINEPFFHLKHETSWIRTQLDEYLIRAPLEAVRVEYLWSEFLALNRISFDEFCKAARENGFDICYCEHFNPTLTLVGAPQDIPASLMVGGGSNLLLRKRASTHEEKPRTGYGKPPAAPAQFDADGLRTVHNSSFLTEPRFQAAYAFGLKVETSAGPDLHIEWRVWVALWAAEQSLMVEGDFVECGVYTGVISGAICNWLEFEKLENRRFWLLDTFDGLPEEQLSESERALNIFNYNCEYRRNEVYEQVCEKFSRFQNVKIIKGDVEETMPQVAAQQVAYLSIDMNMTKPEIAAVRYFWPKLAPGGIIVLDDYNQTLHFHQKNAMDEFARSQGITILGLPTGQGILIKPASAAIAK